MQVAITEGSLTDGSELVLVNASNTNGQLGSGVSAAIRAACGKGFQSVIFEALQREWGGPMPPGELVMTHAGGHPTARFVAHLAVMDYRQGFGAHSMPTLGTVEACCRRLWAALEGLQTEAPLTVAMVALGAGTGSLGVVETTRAIAQSLLTHCVQTPATRLERVTFYGYEMHEYLAMAGVLRGLFPEVDRSLSAEARQFLDAER